MSKLIEFSVEASAKRVPRIEILAYNGGIMTVAGWGPLAIDLKGLDLSAPIPLLADHDDQLHSIVGSGIARIEGSNVLVSGTVTRASEAGKLVLGLAADGVRLQASVGVQPEKYEAVRAGQNAMVNGKRLTAPAGGLTVVRKGRLREVSIVPAGADMESSVSIAARRRKTVEGLGMDDSTEATAVEQEKARLDEIDAAAAEAKLELGMPDDVVEDIRASAARGGWTGNQTRLHLLRESRPKVGSLIREHRGANAGVTPAVLAAAALIHAGRARVAERSYGADLCQRAEDLRLNSLADIAHQALRAEGQDVPAGLGEMVRAAFSTVSMPTLLGDTAQKILLNAYEETPASWRSFAAVRNAKDFRTHTAIRPNLHGQVEEVAPTGEIKHSHLTEGTYDFKVSTFGKMLGISRQDIINDDIGAFADLAAGLGRMARRGINDLVWQVILANAGSFFSGANSNDLGAVGLDSTQLQAAVTALRTQRDAEGNDLDLKPAALVVAPELEATARALIESTMVAVASADDTTTTTVPAGNALKSIAQLSIESRLSNTTKFSGANAALWYLFGSPADAPVVVAFLNGQQNPTVEFFGLQTNPNVLGLSWRVYHDYGCAFGDPKAAVRAGV